MPRPRTPEARELKRRRRAERRMTDELELHRTAGLVRLRERTAELEQQLRAGRRCGRCAGRGQVLVPVAGGVGIHQDRQLVTCPACGGS